MLPRDLHQQLHHLFADRFHTDKAALQQHSHDESWHPPQLPDAVVYPQNNQEVAKLVQLCSDHRMPIIPFGTGTGVEGHAIPIQGGVTVALSLFNQIIEINLEDQYARVGAGVTRLALNEALRHTGLFFSVDPGADASIGGMAATRASGTNTIRYGTMADNVLGLTAIMANGSQIETGNRARKSASGYDLTHLLLGSEGTLGIITEVIVRLHPRPEQASAAVVSFPNIHNAVSAVIDIIQSAVGVARIELLDHKQIEACNQYSQLDLKPLPTLFLEFHGSANNVQESAQRCQEITASHQGGDYQWSHLEEERNRLWQARHHALYATKQLRPDCEVWTTDICVPISKLADAIVETRQDIDQMDLCATIVGHVGDGNFHTLICLDRSDPQEYQTVEIFNDRLIARALRLDGTCSGEHGIGIGKLKYLSSEHGQALEVMNTIKQALDPLGILNPGKLGQANLVKHT